MADDLQELKHDVKGISDRLLQLELQHKHNLELSAEHRKADRELLERYIANDERQREAIERQILTLTTGQNSLNAALANNTTTIADAMKRLADNDVKMKWIGYAVIGVVFAVYGLDAEGLGQLISLVKNFI